MSWEDIIKDNTKKKPFRHEGYPFVDYDIDDIKDSMENWNQTIAKIQTMLYSLKTHPVFDFPPVYSRPERINQDIDSIRNQIDRELTFKVIDMKEYQRLIHLKR